MGRQQVSGRLLAPRRMRRQTASPRRHPESALPPPILHAVSRVVVADDVLVRVVVPPNDRQLLHVEARFLKFLHRAFRCRVVVKHCNHRVCVRHVLSPLQCGFGWLRVNFVLPLCLPPADSLTGGFLAPPSVFVRRSTSRGSFSSMP